MVTSQAEATNPLTVTCSSSASESAIHPSMDPLAPAVGPAEVTMGESGAYLVTQENGQRKVGPPVGWDGEVPARGCEVFVGKIPRDCDERELLPVFERVGRVYEIRLMMDFNGTNRGYCFVTFSRREEARRSVRELDNYEIRKNRYIGVCASVDNCRLFVGGLPRNKQQPEINNELRRLTEDVVDVIVYADARDKTKNRGFAFVEYSSHRAAAMARRNLIAADVQPWGQPLAIDWAEPEVDVDEDIMSKVKILYVRNLMMSTTEETVERLCNEAVGKELAAVERVKKIRDYAFVHFKEREDALTAMERLNGTEVEGSLVEIVLAKPVDKATNNARRNRTDEKSSIAGQIMPVVAGVSYVTMGTIGSGANQMGTVFSPGVFTSATPSPTCMNILTGSVQREIAGRNPLVMAPTIRDSSNKSRARGAGGIGRVYSQTRFPYKKTHCDVRPFAPCMLPGGFEFVYGSPFIANPSTTAPQLKTSTQILEEICVASGWGFPSYQLYTTMAGSATEVPPLFLFKITIASLNCSLSTPNKLCPTVDEAKNYASQCALTELGFVPASDAAVLSSHFATPSVTSLPPSSIYPAGFPGVASLQQPVTISPPQFFQQLQPRPQQVSAEAGGRGVGGAGIVGTRTDLGTADLAAMGGCVPVFAGPALCVLPTDKLSSLANNSFQGFTASAASVMCPSYATLAGFQPF